MKFKNEIVRGLKWTAGAKFGSQLITWGITIFVMRLLAPADYGLLAMASVFFALLGMFAEIGLGPALVQQAETSPQKLRQAFGVILLINLALFILLNASASLIALFYAEPKLTDVIRVMSLQFLIIPFLVIPEVLLQRRLDFKYRSLSDLGSTVIGSVATLILALSGFGVWSLAIGNLAGVFFRAVFFNIFAPFRAWPSFSLQGMRSTLAFGGNVTGSKFLWFFFTQADTVIVGRVLGGEILGIYSVALHLATLPVQRVSAILNQVAFPAFSRFQHDRELIAAQLLKALGLIALVAFPVLWGMSGVTPELIAVLLGPKWTAAILPMQILTLVMPFRAVVGFLPSVTDAIGRPEIGMSNALLGCIVMPIAFYIGAQWGIKGVSLAWLLVYPIVLAINMKRMISAVGVRLRDVLARLAPTLMCAVGMYLAIAGTRLLIAGRTDHLGTLIIEIAVGGLTYIVLTLLLNPSAMTDLKPMFSRKSA
jgi:O-antigen/teichoic acid export membrane protein